MLKTSIDIDASAAVVWQILIDLPNYRAWNPFIFRVDGACRVNELVRVHMSIPGKGRQEYKVRLMEITEQKAFRWQGKFHLPGLIDGFHSFTIENLPDGRVRVHQDEDFRGILVPLVWRGFITQHLLPSFERLNLNLKALAEKKPLPHALAT